MHHDRRNGFDIVKCAGCGFRFAVIPDGFELDAIYTDDAFWNGGRSYGYQPNYDEALKITANLFRERVARISRLRKPGRMLEVGCAGGYVLKVAQQAGWDVAGIEISPMMRRRCAELVKCPLYTSLEEVIAAGSRFDCVVMFEVLEHVTDPVGMLKAFRRVMEPNTLLAVSTPNFESHGAETGSSASVWFEPPSHISYYGPATLTACVNRAGFEVVEMERRLNPDMPLPAWAGTLLRPFRRGKRLRPHGVIGRMLKQHQLRRPEALYWMDYLVIYARKIG